MCEDVPSEGWKREHDMVSANPNTRYSNDKESYNESHVIIVSEQS